LAKLSMPLKFDILLSYFCIFKDIIIFLINKRKISRLHVIKMFHNSLKTSFSYPLTATLIYTNITILTRLSFLHSADAISFRLDTDCLSINIVSFPDRQSIQYFVWTRFSLNCNQSSHRVITVPDGQLLMTQTVAKSEMSVIFYLSLYIQNVIFYY
jgi:hypothetical protein